jgi:hypothetical protein
VTGYQLITHRTEGANSLLLGGCMQGTSLFFFANEQKQLVDDHTELYCPIHQGLSLDIVGQV